MAYPASKKVSVRYCRFLPALQLQQALYLRNRTRSACRSVCAPAATSCHAKLLPGHYDRLTCPSPGYRTFPRALWSDRSSFAHTRADVTTPLTSLVMSRDIYRCLVSTGTARRAAHTTGTFPGLIFRLRLPRVLRPGRR